MQRLCLISLVFLPALASAYDTVRDGIYYNLNSKTYEAEVTSNPDIYEGDIVIPPTFTLKGQEYTVTKIGVEAFYYSPITSVSIPNTVTTIDNYAFRLCRSLNKVTIPSGVTTIGQGVFRQCDGLKKVIFDNCVPTLGSGVFENCKNLYSVLLPEGFKEISFGTFYNCEKLSSITIPSSVTLIGWASFHGCSNLKTIEIPNSVLKIDDSAFENCSKLETVKIGSGIKIINTKAFSNCTDLKNVYILAEIVPTTSKSAFDGSYIDYASLYVPDSSIENYKTSDPWSGFKEIKNLSGQDLPKCNVPTISYSEGKIYFNCETDGVSFVSEITDTDIQTYYKAEIPLSVAYKIRVYATKAGYYNSEMATATLCWIEAEPKSEGLENSIAHISTRPVMIQYIDGYINVTGADDDQPISLYDIKGDLLGHNYSRNGSASIPIGMNTRDFIIVKIGSKSIKVILK